jgi:hypothetical protein
MVIAKHPVRMHLHFDTKYRVSERNNCLIFAAQLRITHTYMIEELALPVL